MSVTYIVQPSITPTYLLQEKKNKFVKLQAPSVSADNERKSSLRKKVTKKFDQELAAELGYTKLGMETVTTIEEINRAEECQVLENVTHFLEAYKYFFSQGFALFQKMEIKMNTYHEGIKKVRRRSYIYNEWM